MSTRWDFRSNPKCLVAQLTHEQTVIDIGRCDREMAPEKNNAPFQNGAIEVKVMSRLRPNALEFARGFIGAAFRINADDTKFECI
jgi:hypothetical protein